MTHPKGHCKRSDTSTMAALVTLLLLGWLGRVWCCSPQPGAINVARKGITSQSSVFPTAPIYAYSYKANDGVTDQNFKNGTCAQTYKDWQPWWRIDLLQRYNVYVIVIYGRSDANLEQLEGLEVHVGNGIGFNNPLCGTITDYNITRTTFCCNGMQGQYIFAVIPMRYEVLTLCEVEIYNGTRTENDVCW